MRIGDRGFTLIEMLLVFVIMGIVLSLAAPKLGQAAGQMAVHNARNEVSAMISLTRALAVQNGRRATFVQEGGTVRVELSKGYGSAVDIMAVRDLSTQHGVTVGPSEKLEIPFDPRGFAIPDNSGPARLMEISRDRFTDEVCVIGLGKISTDKCSILLQ
jgi:type II secretion system protein H